MSRWLDFASLEMLHLAWMVPAAGVLVYLTSRRAAAALARLSARAADLAALDRRRRRIRHGLSLAALGLIVLALTRPGWNPQAVVVHQAGRDVVFAVDVSRSMLADDLVPSRLERAKLAILDTLPELAGNRVAVVAFAGSAHLVCPLTRDYGFFRWAVEGLSPADAERSGSLIGDAVRKVTTDVFDPLEKRYKDLILISDGEDQGSFPVEAARVAGEEGVRIIAVGLGDEGAGSRIPLFDAEGGRTYLTHQGLEVWTRLEADTLRQAAVATPGGRYLHAATGAFDLGEIYRELVAAGEGRDTGPVEIIRYQEKFQLFLLAAFALLAAEMLIPERSRRLHPAGAANRAAKRVANRAVGRDAGAGRARPVGAHLPFGLLLALVVAAMTVGPAVEKVSARGTAELVAEGNAAYWDGGYERAATRYDAARERGRDPAVPLFNLGVALFRQDNLPAALSAFEGVGAPDPGLAPLVHYNQGSVLARLGEAAAEQDPQTGLNLYRLSVAAFKRALELEPDLLEAAYNVEVVRLWIDELLQTTGLGPDGSASGGEAQQGRPDGSPSEDSQSGADPSDSPDGQPGEGDSGDGEGSQDGDAGEGSPPAEPPEPLPDREAEPWLPRDETAQGILREEQARREARARSRALENADGRPNW